MSIAAGDLLISTSGDGADFFSQAVVLLVDVDESGALGVTINLPLDATLDQLLPQWAALVSPPHMLFAGGPVSPDGAICIARPLHRNEAPAGWRRVVGDIGLLQLDTPVELAEGAYSDLRIFAGYAGWSPGQLEVELNAGMWIPSKARPDDVFTAAPEGLWRRVLRRQGGQPGLLSTWVADPSQN